MTDQFFERPILNSPYEYPSRHWELDGDGQPTNRTLDIRRRSELITPVPKPRKRRRSKGQVEIVFGREDGLSTEEQEYNPTPIINEIRGWRMSNKHERFQGTGPPSSRNTIPASRAPDTLKTGAEK